MDNRCNRNRCRRWPAYRVWAIVLIWAAALAVGCGNEAQNPQKIPAIPKASQRFEGTIVAVGDSLTAGLGVAEERAYPALLEQKLQSDGYNYRVINAGVSGETSSGALSRIEWVISSLQPDIVILETGANDGLRGIDPGLLETNLNQICALLKENDIEVLLAGMQVLPNLGPDYIEAFSTIYPRVANEHQVVLMPFFLKEVAGDTRLNQPDRIHPTAEGYARITENLYPYVVKTIEKARRAQKVKQEVN